jgi:hypothetical protein
MIMALNITELMDKGWIPQAKNAAIRDSSGERVWKCLAGKGSVGNAIVIPCTALKCRFIFLVEQSV